MSDNKWHVNVYEMCNEARFAVPGMPYPVISPYYPHSANFYATPLDNGDTIDRLSNFIAQYQVDYTLINPQGINPTQLKTAVSHDTVWAIQPAEKIDPLWSLFNNSSSDPYQRSIQSLLIAFILLKQEGRDPLNKLFKIGICDICANQQRQFDMRNLHPSVYNDIFNAITG